MNPSKSVTKSPALAAMLGLACFAFVLTLMTAAKAVPVEANPLAILTPTVPAEFYGFLAAALMGFLATALYWNPYRLLGFVPYFSVVWSAALVVGVAWNVWSGWLLGLSAAATANALLLGASRYRTPWWRPAAVGGLLAGIACHLALREGIVAVRVADVALGLVFVVGTVALLSWLNLFRPWFELNIEVPLWVSYRIRGAGPGFVGFPVHGPCLVIANHACWVDPIFLAKLLPRSLTPMMTGRFYDLPVISFLMRRFGIIKVREQPMKRELPEVQEAIAALDRGECVVVFPEGYLRRSDDRPLKRFGQGVWQILKARPGTPVYAGWIEGNWGSFTSYFRGKPTKNKKPDLRRPIGVGLSSPIVLDAALLESHLKTRIFLMNRVLEARTHLGLPEVAAFELPTLDESEE